MAGSAAAKEPEIAGQLPRHIAIIMDGNGRWAKQKGIARVRGHKAGSEALGNVLEACADLPYLEYLTVYAFSSENWKRAPEEVTDLMNLLRYYLAHEAKNIMKQNIRLRFIGARHTLPEDIQQELAAAEAKSAGNTRLTLAVAISYGARQELVYAAQRIAECVQAGDLQPADITEDTIRSYIDTADLPDPDLLIRTGGEERLSNFLLWQSAYTELYFTDVLWPDFNAEELQKAIQCYSSRERRFGARRDGSNH